MKTPIQNNLKNLREKAGLLQIDVARGIGLGSSDRISHWEQGRSYPGVANLFKLARFFGVTVDTLYANLYGPKEKGSVEPPAL